jgi:hypothetical protein
MIFEYLAGYLSTFIYLLPPFKQYKGKYFLFFLILALGDPVELFFIFIIHLNPNRIICLIAWSMLLALIKNNYLTLIFTILLMVGVFLLPVPLIQTLSILVDYLIMIYFLKETIIYYRENSSIHSGLIILVLYSMGLILKLYSSISSIHFGHLYFYIIDFFEVIVAIFFIIFKVEEAPKIKLQKID